MTSMIPFHEDVMIGYFVSLINVRRLDAVPNDSRLANHAPSESTCQRVPEATR